jgi:hypothetical protein
MLLMLQMLLLTPNAPQPSPITPAVATVITNTNALTAAIATHAASAVPAAIFVTVKSNSILF